MKKFARDALVAAAGTTMVLAASAAVVFALDELDRYRKTRTKSRTVTTVSGGEKL